MIDLFLTYFLPGLLVLAISGGIVCGYFVLHLWFKPVLRLLGLMCLWLMAIAVVIVLIVALSHLVNTGFTLVGAMVSTLLFFLLFVGLMKMR